MSAIVTEGRDAGLALGLAGDTLPPGGRVANQHRELGPGLAGEPEEGDEADGLGAAVKHDRPFAVAALFHRSLDPHARILLGEALAPGDEIRGHPLVVEPATNGCGILGPKVPQLDGGHGAARLLATRRGLGRREGATRCAAGCADRGPASGGSRTRRRARSAPPTGSRRGR